MRGSGKNRPGDVPPRPRSVKEYRTLAPFPLKTDHDNSFPDVRIGRHCGPADWHPKLSFNGTETRARIETGALRIPHRYSLKSSKKLGNPLHSRMRCGIIRSWVSKSSLPDSVIPFPLAVSFKNIPGIRQEYLLETLRTLKKGGTFALHDIFSRAKYGDMQAFVRKLRDMGFEDVRLIDTTDGTFMTKRKAAWMGLSGSALLVGRR